jgi:hypothetical protein
MPEADTVWPIPLTELVLCLAKVGLAVGWMRECTRAHLLVANALIVALESERSAIAADVGETVVDDLLNGHRLWSSWLTSGRIRKFAVVAARTN